MKLDAVAAQADYYRKLTDLTPQALLAAAGGNGRANAAGLISLNSIGAENTMSALSAGARADDAEKLSENYNRRKIFTPIRLRILSLILSIITVIQVS